MPVLAAQRCLLRRAATTVVLPHQGPDLISLVTTREEISDLLALDDVIDLVIPRGGNALVSYIQVSGARIHLCNFEKKCANRSNLVILKRSVQTSLMHFAKD